MITPLDVLRSSAKCPTHKDRAAFVGHIWPRAVAERPSHTAVVIAVDRHRTTGISHLTDDCAASTLKNGFVYAMVTETGQPDHSSTAGRDVCLFSREDCHPVTMVLRFLAANKDQFLMQYFIRMSTHKTLSLRKTKYVIRTQIKTMRQTKRTRRRTQKFTEPFWWQ